MRVNVELTTGSIIRSEEMTEADMTRRDFGQFLALVKDMDNSKGHILIPNDNTPLQEEQMTFIPLSKIVSVTIIDPLYQD